MKILKEKQLPLLKRTRVTAEVEHFKKATPSEQSVLEQLSKETKTPADAISILHLYSHYGIEKTKIIANIYKSKEDKETFEKINKKQKKTKEGETAAPAQEAPKAEEKPTEAPKKEEKKEEKPAEEKKE
jgi:ribosomal protein S24E